MSEDGRKRLARMDRLVERLVAGACVMLALIIILDVTLAIILPGHPERCVALHLDESRCNR